jgi:hypothetical protein
VNQSAVYSFGCLAGVGRVELTFSVDRQHDGSWLLQVDVSVLDEDDYAQRKVPTTLLQRHSEIVLGIETEFAANGVFESLVGQLPERPDPTEFYARIETMLKDTDLELFWREPQPAAYWGKQDCFLDPDLP